MRRFSIADDEIRNGASLTVREAQMAMFVDEGATEELLGNNVAVGALFGAVSVSIGILNAACLTCLT